MEENRPVDNATPPPAEVAAQPQPVDDLIDLEYFSRLKLRVARVEAVEAVPKSTKLLKLQVDLGPLGKRQVLAGIAQYVTPESLLGRKIVVISNLKPAKLMGQESQGMLLAASSEDGTLLSVVDPGQDMPPGSTVR